MAEKKCRHCAMIIPKEANVCPFCRKKIGLSVATKILLTLLLSFIGLILAIGLFSTPQKSLSTYTPKEDQFNQMSPREHLSEAKKALDEWKPQKDPMRTQWGRVSDAEKHLAAIPKTSPEWTGEGQKLWKEVERRGKEIQKIASLTTKKLMIQQRKEFAKQYELSLLDQGMDTRISTLGKDHSTLKIEWVLMSRPLVYKMINDSSVMSNLKKLGFKKIVFSDGYNHTWTSEME